MASRQFNLTFGAMAEQITRQLVRQGWILPVESRQRIQDLADAITRLAIHGLLSEPEVKRARQRLVKEVSRLAEAAPGLRGVTRG